jgi:hypothetical protein
MTHRGVSFAECFERPAPRTDDAEVLLQAVPDEDAAHVDEQAQLLVRHLERHERVLRRGGIKVALCDACVSWCPRCESSATHARCRRIA